MSIKQVAAVEVVIDVKCRTANLVVLWYEKYVVQIVTDGKRNRSYEEIAGFGSDVGCSMMARTSLVCCRGNGCQEIMVATC